jgi:hypothetical protein
VAQSWAATWHPAIGLGVYQNFMESMGVEPRPPLWLCSLVVFGLPLAHTVVFIMYVAKYVFEFDLSLIWRGVGPGLSPGPWLYCV